MQGLKEAGAAEAAPLLRARFRREPDLGVRRALLAALGVFRDERSRGLIADVLRDPQADPELKAEAISAAERVGGEEVARAVRDALQTAQRGSPTETAAVVVLGRLKYAPAVSLLETIAAASGEEDQVGRL